MYSKILLFVAQITLYASLQGIDLDFPVGPGERGTVSTLLWPDEKYDIYLPSGYSATGDPLPLFFTLAPGGGGMVSNFQTVAEEKQVIVIGLLDSKNNLSYRYIYPNVHAVLRDVMQRLNYDPTAVYAAGFSGGGWGSYDMTKFYRPHITGVLPMGGWLGAQYNNYDRFAPGLLVARTTGSSDTGALYYRSQDRWYLETFGVIVQDYSFSGGHQVAPDSTKRLAIDWLLENRTPAEPGAYAEAKAAAEDWETRLESGDDLAVFTECVNALLNEPQSFLSREAQLIVWRMMDDYEQFSQLDTRNQFTGNFANDLFWGISFGPAYLGDLDIYYSAAMTAERVTETDGDFLLDPHDYMLSEVGLPTAQARFAFTSDSAFNRGTVSFDAASSIAPWSEITGYSWNFGDGTEANGVSVTHQYSENGNYSVSLALQTPEGPVASEVVEIVVGEPPVIHSIDAPGSINIRDALVLAVAASHSTVLPLSYEWEQLEGPGAVQWSANDTAEVSARFSTPGLYRIMVSVSAGNVEARETIAVEIAPDDWDDDRDGLTNSSEDILYDGVVEAGESNRWHPDHDGDGLWDAEERLWNTDPLTPDPVFGLQGTAEGTRNWSADFESGPYQLGAIANQFAWRTLSGSATVDTGVGNGGSQGLAFYQTDETTAVEAYWGVQRAPFVTVEFSGKLSRGSLPTLNQPIKSAALLMVNEDGLLSAFNGLLDNWSVTSTELTEDAWYDFKVELDYDSKTWNLLVDGDSVLNDFPFANPDLNRFSRLKITQHGGAATATVLDDLAVTARQPYLDWLMEHFDSVESPISSLSSDPDGDGKNNFIEYVFGGDPRFADQTPASPHLVGMASSLEFCFTPSRTDIDSLVESSPDLSPESWQPVSYELSVNSEGEHRIPISLLDGQSFYRLRLINYQ